LKEKETMAWVEKNKSQEYNEAYKAIKEITPCKFTREKLNL
jgi:hypothetical protein